MAKARANEERTDREEDAAGYGSGGSPPAGFASVTPRAGAKRRTPQAQPEGLTGVKGAIRSTALRTGDPMDSTRARRPVGAREDVAHRRA